MFNVEDFIRKQIALYRSYDTRSGQEKRAGRGKAGKLICGPYLLISREKGAGGSAVAHLAGQRLGWQVFDKEIVDSIAQNTNVRRELIESVDERYWSTIEEMVGEVLQPQSIENASYQTHLREVLLTLGHQGDVVIVGRGAQYILPSQFGLRVRLVAQVEERIRRIASRNKLSLDAARAEVERSDRDRAKLARREHGQEWANSLSYDLIINTTELTIEAATEVVITAVRQKLALVPR